MTPSSTSLDFAALIGLAPEASDAPEFVRLWCLARAADQRSAAESRVAWEKVASSSPDDWSDTSATAEVRALTAGAKLGLPPATLVPELRSAMQWTSDPDLWSAAARLLRRLDTSSPDDVPVIAVIGSGNLQLVIDALRVALFRDGVEATVWSPPFGTWREQLQDSESELAVIRPFLVVFVANAIGPYGIDSHEFHNVAEEFRSRVGSELAVVCPSVAGLSESRVLSPHITPDTIDRFDRASSVPRLLESCHVVFEPVLASEDATRLWDTGKFSRTPRGAVSLANDLCSLFRAITGASRKVLAVDLDNTLWGGIVGEDGVAGLQIGQGSAMGEGYYRLQRYITGLVERGIALVALSKNNPADVEQVFLERANDLALGKRHFVSIEASWSDKSVALKRVIDRLNVSIGSVVFLDDNPAERAAMRAAQPDVLVINSAPDPWAMLSTLVWRDPFSAVRVTSGDRLRSDSLKNRVDRVSTAEEPTPGDYLAGLKMTIDVHPTTPAETDRVTQLVNKTNQFNLNGVRRTSAEVQASLESISLSAVVSDRFEDLGLVGFLGATVEGASCIVHTWVLSCRAFGRRVEDAMIDELRRRVGPDIEVQLVFKDTGRNKPFVESAQRLGLG